MDRMVKCTFNGREIYLFQSTLPVRGATVISVDSVTVDGISIHAPRAGGDC